MCNFIKKIELLNFSNNEIKTIVLNTKLDLDSENQIITKSEKDFITTIKIINYHKNSIESYCFDKDNLLYYLYQNNGNRSFNILLKYYIENNVLIYKTEKDKSKKYLLYKNSNINILSDEDSFCLSSKDSKLSGLKYDKKKHICYCDEIKKYDYNIGRCYRCRNNFNKNIILYGILYNIEVIKKYLKNL